MNVANNRVMPQPIELEPTRLPNARDRRLEPRVPVYEHESITLQLPIHRRRFAVADLSAHGLSIINLHGSSSLQVGTITDGTVDFWGLKIPVRLEVTTMEGGKVGCRLKLESQPWFSQLENLSLPVRIAQNLREIDPTRLRPDQTGDKTRWYQSGSDCDVLAWYSGNGHVVQIQVYVKNRVADWSLGAGVRTGRVGERPISLDNIDIPELELQYPPEPETLRLVRRVVVASQLPDEIVDKFFEEVTAVDLRPTQLEFLAQDITQVTNVMQPTFVD